jgi:RNA polymerase sigma-70 factor (ECF subfamily)
LLIRESFEGFEENIRSEIDVEETAAIAEVQGRVRDALKTLPFEQREVIELAYYDGLSHSEIALQLEQPLGTVKTRMRLGMMKLRDILQPGAAELIR